MMPLRLTLLGIGSVRCAPPVIGSLASYFGERDLEVRLYDEDPERLDLFDRFARRCFAAENAKHAVLAFEDGFEALEGADLVILMVGENCARRFLNRNETGLGSVRSRGGIIRLAVDGLMRAIPDGAPVLSLLRGVKGIHGADITVLAWPADIPAQNRASIPHQVLRWIRGEEMPYELIESQRNSLVKQWLDQHSP